MKWNLFYHNSEKDSGIGLSLHEDRNSFVTKSIGLTMAIINKKGDKISVIKKCVSEWTRMPETILVISQDQALNKSEEFLVNGHLTIYCEIQTVLTKEKVHMSGTMTYASFNNSEDQLTNDLETLFSDMKFTDVSIIVRDRQFEAHKSMLSARSPVFAAMFEHPTKEKISNQIVVHNIEADVFQEVLRYIYTGRIPSSRMEEVAAELFYAADKYLLEKLKQECEKHFINRLCAENCLELLSLADCHSAVSLKQTALDYVRRFPAEVVATDNRRNLNPAAERETSISL